MSNQRHEIYAYDNTIKKWVFICRYDNYNEALSYVERRTIYTPLVLMPFSQNVFVPRAVSTSDLFSCGATLEFYTITKEEVMILRLRT